jgi:hypothetical protein
MGAIRCELHKKKSPSKRSKMKAMSTPPELMTSENLDSGKSDWNEM